jgi:hypothetical protein
MLPLDLHMTKCPDPHDARPEILGTGVILEHRNVGPHGCRQLYVTGMAN